MQNAWLHSESATSALRSMQMQHSDDSSSLPSPVFGGSIRLERDGDELGAGRGVGVGVAPFDVTADEGATLSRYNFIRTNTL